MALNKLKYNSLNLTPAANKAIGFDSDADALEATLEGGAMTFIKKLTASSSGTLSFVDGSSDVVLDSTYKEYIFIFKDIHAATNGANFTFQANASGGSGYNETITSTAFRPYHGEDDSSSLGYKTSGDQAQGTSFQGLSFSLGDENDESCCGTLHLFNPSSTTFVKNFISDFSTMRNASPDASIRSVGAGLFNTTSAVDAIQFKMSTGNIDSGTITLYGIN